MVASDRPRLRLGLLDGTIAGPGGQPIQIAQRQFELMAFLALHETAGADRDAILDAIWPDLDPTAAAHALKTAAHRIRTALSDPAAVLLTPRGYRLPDSIETDVERLEMILATVDPEDVAARLGGLSAAYRLVAVAVEQVRDGISRWTWVDRYIPRLDFLLRRLARVIAARAIHTGRFEFAHRIVGDLRTLDEADETAFEIAIDAYFAAGNQISARREYDRYVEVLKTFGGAPAPAVAALFNTAAVRRTRA
jgi:DNA-binding SARP family transcriptional activator